jgi:cellulose synthase/poly-beta-1,6-N-acetylglucosamine synthase-like glycosyltransferase
VTRLSVFMPVLNEEASVLAAVDSVLAQAAPGLELEVLVADGCSADATAALVAERAAADPRVRLLANPAVTIPAALNVCLAAATGDHVARIDGHSEISPGYFAAALAWLAADPGLAGVGGHRTGTASTPVGRAVCLVLSSRFGVGNSIYHYATQRQETDHATFGVYRAEAVREVGGWDEDLPVNEDVDFDHRLLERGWRLGYEPAMVVRWQVRETLGGLFGQYRRYGRGKAAMVRKNGRSAVRLRHLAPPAAVGGSAAVLVAGAVGRPWFLLALTPYAGLVAVASVLAYRKRDAGVATSWPALPAAFVTTHAAWGLGFLEGLLLRRAPARASGRSDVRTGEAAGSPA